MLQGNFFEISNLKVQDFTIQADLEINARHKIFQGHFPQQPVVPGVCMMQMVKEIIEQVIEKKTNLSKAAEMKFLAVIDPLQNNHIQATLKYAIEEDDCISVSARVFKNELIHFKFKGLFKIVV
jgi:3-hydroxyacyl-[acyl-carrier-protein] dehydratase